MSNISTQKKRGTIANYRHEALDCLLPDNKQ
jgi:hypothetical protein